MPLTITDLMSKMPGAFQPDKAPGLEAVIQFKFTGDEVDPDVQNPLSKA